MSNLAALDMNDFTARVANSPVPVLIDFWAPWCGPCKMLAPVLDTVADHFGERLTILKVDVDQHKEVYERFQFRGIPALILFDGGKEIARQIGVTSKLRLAALIEKSVTAAREADATPKDPS